LGPRLDRPRSRSASREPRGAHRGDEGRCRRYSR